MKILILGANGFIGSWLVERILATTSWNVTGFDIHSHNLGNVIAHERFVFKQGDVRKESSWIEEEIRESDVVLPLVAIANPAVYVKDPLRIFELDFESNLDVIRKCVKHKKRVVFPSTSEVYGMSPDAEFDEETTNLVVGPIQKQRWIYSCCKQMLDRVIYAYGEKEGLSYTLFRPFNWMGPRLDDVHSQVEGSSRALTQFISNALYGRPIKLVDGGAQKRCFIYIEDALDALMKIIENKDGCATNRVFNIGNPKNNFSILEVAQMVLAAVREYPSHLHKAHQTKIEMIDSQTYFGSSYQDTQLRVPSIKRAKEYLNWEPRTDLQVALEKTLDYYMKTSSLQKST
jgi:nucleoside-diphosphate-sugar epimerase